MWEGGGSVPVYGGGGEGWKGWVVERGGELGRRGWGRVSGREEK